MLSAGRLFTLGDDDIGSGVHVDVIGVPARCGGLDGLQ